MDSVDAKIKNKILMYNEAKEILLISKKTRHNNRYYKLLSLEAADNLKELEQFYDRKKLIKLCDISYQTPILNCENNKFKKIFLKYIRNYYAFYSEIQAGDVKQMNRSSNQYGYHFILMHIDEIRNLLFNNPNLRRYPPNVQNKRKGMIIAIDEFEKKCI